MIPIRRKPPHPGRSERPNYGFRPRTPILRRVRRLPRSTSCPPPARPRARCRVPRSLSHAGAELSGERIRLAEADISSSGRRLSSVGPIDAVYHLGDSVKAFSRKELPRSSRNGAKNPISPLAERTTPPVALSAPTHAANPRAAVVRHRGSFAIPTSESTYVRSDRPHEPSRGVSRRGKPLRSAVIFPPAGPTCLRHFHAAERRSTRAHTPHPACASRAFSRRRLPLPTRFHPPSPNEGSRLRPAPTGKRHPSAGDFAPRRLDGGGHTPLTRRGNAHSGGSGGPSSPAPAKPSRRAAEPRDLPHRSNSAPFPGSRERTAAACPDRPGRPSSRPRKSRETGR